jgi:hypothetical protein
MPVTGNTEGDWCGRFGVRVKGPWAPFFDQHFIADLQLVNVGRQFRRGGPVQKRTDFLS